MPLFAFAFDEFRKSKSRIWQRKF